MPDSLLVSKFPFPVPGAYKGKETLMGVEKASQVFIENQKMSTPQHKDKDLGLPVAGIAGEKGHDDLKTPFP
jgi:hypothetical protein